MRRGAFLGVLLASLLFFAGGQADARESARGRVPEPGWLQSLQSLWRSWELWLAGPNKDDNTSCIDPAGRPRPCADSQSSPSEDGTQGDTTSCIDPSGRPGG
jgi:hypothetical protein